MLGLGSMRSLVTIKLSPLSFLPSPSCFDPCRFPDGELLCLLHRLPGDLPAFDLRFLCWLLDLFLCDGLRGLLRWGFRNFLCNDSRSLHCFCKFSFLPPAVRVADS